MDDSALAELVRSVDREDERFWDWWQRVKKLNKVKELIPEPLGVFRKSCPYCHARLKVVRKSLYFSLFPTKYTHYICPDCAYEYGTSSL